MWGASRTQESFPVPFSQSADEYTPGNGNAITDWTPDLSYCSRQTIRALFRS